MVWLLSGLEASSLITKHLGKEIEYVSEEFIRTTTDYFSLKVQYNLAPCLAKCKAIGNPLSV